jgi:hypothetical protein
MTPIPDCSGKPILKIFMRPPAKSWPLRHCVFTLLILLLMVHTFARHAAAAAPTTTAIALFSPEGTVKNVRQVRAQFSEAMVPFGDLRLNDPFDVDCPQPIATGAGRWADGQNWIYDFGRDLPGGVRCTFTLKKDARDLAGQPLTGRQTFSFDTGGPAILHAIPRSSEWAQIDEQQIFILGLDAPVQRESMLANTYCIADGINEKIGVRLIEGKERATLLATRRDFTDRYRKLYFAARGAAWVATLRLKDQQIDALPLVLLQCKQTLPADAKISLVWGAGIQTDSGVATAEKQFLNYKVRADFNARFSCTRVRADAACVPFLPLELALSSPVKLATARAVILTDAQGRVHHPSFTRQEAKAEFVSTINFKGSFAEKSSLTIALPPHFVDDSGRALTNADMFPLTVKTDELPPLVKFPARFGIIELQGDRALPVTLRNLDAPPQGKRADVIGQARKIDGDQEVLRWLGRMGLLDLRDGHAEQYQFEKSLFDEQTAGKKFTLPKPRGASAFEVIGIPLREPGLHVVEINSPRLGSIINSDGGSAYVSAAALVTNLAAHLKIGRESSLVWVTSLDRGQPVAGATVSVRDCKARLLWRGPSDKAGIARINSALKAATCGYQQNLFVSVRKGADMSFTMSNWTGGIQSWRFGVPTGGRNDNNLLTTTVFDRTLLRVGETVHMKHFVRRHSGSGLLFADKSTLPATMQLIHQGSNQRYTVPLSWSPVQDAASEWKIPAGAKQGVYEVSIGGRAAGQFRVEAFRVPTMRALIVRPKQPAVQAESIDVDLQLNYLGGGAAAHAPVKLRTVLGRRDVQFKGYEGFAFARGDVQEGRREGARSFDDGDSEMEGGVPGVSANNAAPVTRAVTLDAGGAARVTLDQLQNAKGRSSEVRDLSVELEYQDANGETLTSSARIPLWSARVAIGIKPAGWIAASDDVRFQVVVLGIDGKPVADAPVMVDFFENQTYSHRRRLLGGFYAYENSREIKRAGQACSGKTDARGLLSCAAKPTVSGSLILRATTADAAGNAAVTNYDIWVAGKDETWFDAHDNDRIELLADKKRYEPGETAVLQVRMPFRSATALVTVEREGVLESFVRPLSGKDPQISLPIKGVDAPNVFVSVFVVRGRVNATQPTALLDLGKPAYKMGLAQLRVGWQAHELDVKVSSDKPVYKTRDKAQVVVKVRRADGSALPAGTEATLAAVDVGLLELMPNTSWNLLEAMMQERSLQVETATAQMQVIGKRHFGRKAVPHGGGGGKGQGRELFETLLYWNPHVKLDDQGEATIEVPINDSLTEFRIVAIANGAAGLFGTGKTDIRTTQDLILVSGLPAVVREGDRLRAGFTVRNTTERSMQLALAGRVGEEGKTTTALPQQSITLPAGAAQEVSWDYLAPLNSTTLLWDISAHGMDGDTGSDQLRVRQKVTPSLPVRTYQATLLQLDGSTSIPIQMPTDAQPGRGGIRALLTARLADDLPGVREYMQLYPYTCFEQSTSRAIALHDAALWRTTVGGLPAYLDSDGLVKYFPTLREGSDSLTAYILSVTQEAGFTIPAATRQKMEDALIAFVSGRLQRYSSLQTADLAIRKMAALEALSRSGRVKQELLDSVTLEPNLWPTSAVIDWYLVLQRSPALRQRDVALAQAEQILRSRLNFQGTTMGFSTERQDDLWWLMVSGDVNANRLLLAMLDNPRWAADMGRLARGSLGRQHKGRWNTTVANAWGVLALDKFSQKFEREAVSGSTQMRLGDIVKTQDWNQQPKGASLDLPWPTKRAALKLEQNGSGKPWVTVQSLAAIPLTAPISSGYKIAKTITPVTQKQAGVWSRGDVFRVRLDLEAQSDMTWVVADDPVPTGASILGGGLGRDSRILTQGERREGWVWPAFEERGAQSFRAYYSFVPKGKWTVEYTMRINNPGEFSLPPTHVEAMYAPEMLGEVPNARIVVQP